MMVELKRPLTAEEREAIRAELARPDGVIQYADPATDIIINGWQPIETAPDDLMRAILFGEASGEINGRWDTPVATVGERYRVDGGWYAAVTDAYTVDIKPTHWMPLPEPPKA